MSAYLSLIGRRRGGRLFEAGRLLTFSAFKMGAYSRWALIRGWALIRINTVFCRAAPLGTPVYCLQSHHSPVNDLSTVVQLTNRLLRFWADGGFVYY